MIQLEAVAKGFGGHALFRDVTWQIGLRERIAIRVERPSNVAGKCRRPVLARLRDHIFSHRTMSVSRAGSPSSLGRTSRKAASAIR